MKSGVRLVLVNGDINSIQSHRARHLFEAETKIVYKERGRLGSIGDIQRAVREINDGCIYCIDIGFPSALLAAWRKKISPSVKLIYELGDPAQPLLANQKRPKWEVSIAHQLDKWLPPFADKLVFRGSYLADYFAQLCSLERLPKWIWLPDGVDCKQFRPQRHDPAVIQLRQRHNLEDKFVVGLVGNIHHNPGLNLYYGWELAEALALIPDSVPITGVIVGDGPGKDVLAATRNRLQLGERLRLIGRVPHDEIPMWLNLFDVGLSTQTDDPVGWGRTTSKLPEYLACGLPVLCSDVGEAHRLLKESGQTIPYRGLRDEEYPKRLAARLLELLEADLSIQRDYNRTLAIQLFDYSVLRTKLNQFLD